MFKKRGDHMSTKPVLFNYGNGIVCPVCKGHHSRVTDSRPHKNAILRKRVCLGCQNAFTTQEVFLSNDIRVRRRDGESPGATT